jgi:amino acid permease
MLGGDALCTQGVTSEQPVFEDVPLDEQQRQQPPGTAARRSHGAGIHSRHTRLEEEEEEEEDIARCTPRSGRVHGVHTPSSWGSMRWASIEGSSSSKRKKKAVVKSWGPLDPPLPPPLPVAPTTSTAAAGAGTPSSSSSSLEVEGAAANARRGGKLAPRAARGASVGSSIANLANTNMGIGMLAMPAAMANAGIFGGACLLFVSGGIAAFSSRLLAECVDTVGRPASLSTITEKALGKLGILITDFSVAFTGTSCSIGYLIVVGDMMPEIKAWVAREAHDGGAPPSVLDSRQFWILAALPIVVPLAFLRRLDSLRFASLLVVGCVALIVLTVILFAIEPSDLFDPCSGYDDEVAAALAHAEHLANTVEATVGDEYGLGRPDGDGSLDGSLLHALSNESGSGAEGGGGASGGGRGACRGSVAWQRDAQHTLSALPTFLFAFASQINVASIASELRLPSRRRVDAVLLGGMGLTVIVYLLVAVGGYATYGSNVQGDLFLAYPGGAIVARVALVLVVVLSHPVISYAVSPCVANSMDILHGLATRTHRPPAAAATSAGRLTVFVSDRRQRCIITAYLVSTTFVALSTTDLGIVISLSGAVCATTLIFIAPGACYWKLHRHSHGLTFRTISAAILFTSGCVLVPMCVLLILASRGFFGDEWALEDT